jgi:hypothetical protein
LTNVKIRQLPHDALKTLNAAIFPHILHANANQVSREMEKSCARISTNVRDQVPVESMRIVSIFPEITLVSATMVSKATHTMVVSISTSACTQKHVDPALYVQTLRAVIAATALKVSTAMPSRQDV